MKKREIIIGTMVIALLLIASYAWYYSTHFLLTSSKPSNHGKISYADDITISFNRDLDPKSKETFSISPNVAGDIIVRKNQLIFHSTGLDISAKYTIAMTKPVSSDGLAGKPVTITFTPVYVDFSKLTPEQQKKLGLSTDQAEKRRPTYPGIEALEERGITKFQMDALKANLRIFSPKTKEFTIDTASIRVIHTGKDGPNPTTTAQFDLKTDNQARYKAVMELPDIYKIHLVLSGDADNQVVFDSSNPPPQR